MNLSIKKSSIAGLLMLCASCLFISSCNNSNTAEKDKKSETPVEVKKEAQAATSEKADTQARFVANQNEQEFLNAALNGNSNLIDAALNSGINTELMDEQKHTALMLAAYNGHTEIVKLLLDRGAAVNSVDVTDRTALMFASSGPFPETVKALLDAKAKVNEIDNHENWTALMFAAGEGHIAVAKLLIEAGADPTMVDVDGESSADFAKSKGHHEMVNYLNSLK